MYAQVKRKEHNRKARETRKNKEGGTKIAKNNIGQNIVDSRINNTIQRKIVGVENWSKKAEEQISILQEQAKQRFGVEAEIPYKLINQYYTALLNYDIRQDSFTMVNSINAIYEHPDNDTEKFLKWVSLEPMMKKIPNEREIIDKTEIKFKPEEKNNGKSTVKLPPIKQEEIAPPQIREKPKVNLKSGEKNNGKSTVKLPPIKQEKIVPPQIKEKPKVNLKPEEKNNGKSTVKLPSIKQEQQIRDRLKTEPKILPYDWVVFSTIIEGKKSNLPSSIPTRDFTSSMSQFAALNLANGDVIFLDNQISLKGRIIQHTEIKQLVSVVVRKKFMVMNISQLGNYLKKQFLKYRNANFNLSNKTYKPWGVIGTFTKEELKDKFKWV